MRFNNQLDEVVLSPGTGGEREECKLSFRFFSALLPFFLLAALLFFGAGEGGAAESKLISSAEAKQEYNDNIFLDSNKGRGDLISTLSPGLEWIEKTERMDLRLLGGLDWITYWRHHEFDATDYRYQGDFQYRLTERASLAVGGGGLRDSRPDRDLETTGLILGTAPRNRWFYNVSGNYLLTERNSLGFLFNQSGENFESPKFSDSRSYDGSIQFTRELNETLQGRANLAYDRYAFETSETEVYGLGIGADWKLREKWGLLFDLGLRYIISEFPVAEFRFVPPFFLVPVIKRETRSRYGGAGSIGLTYKGDLTQWSLTFKQDIVPSSGLGATRSSYLRLQIDRRFTYELQGFLAASYALTQADGGEFSASETDVQTANLDARLRYAFTKDMAIEASYVYSRSMDRVADTTADRNLFLIRFNVRHDFLEK